MFQNFPVADRRCFYNSAFDADVFTNPFPDCFPEITDKPNRAAASNTDPSIRSLSNTYKTYIAPFDTPSTVIHSVRSHAV